MKKLTHDPQRNIYDYDFIFGWEKGTPHEAVGFKKSERDEEYRMTLSPFKLNGFAFEKEKYDLKKMPEIEVKLIEQQDCSKFIKNIIRSTSSLS